MPDKPKAGETKEHYMEYCVRELYPAEYDQRQAVAVCINMWEGKSIEAMKTKSPFQRKAEEFQLLSAEKELRLKGIEAADYPWEECVADMTERYGDEETANKVCGMIRSKYGSKE
jgi:hypothetical protein